MSWLLLSKDSAFLTCWHAFVGMHTLHIVQSNLYEEVSFGTKTKWPYKTSDHLKEVDFALWMTIYKKWNLFRSMITGRGRCNYNTLIVGSWLEIINLQCILCRYIPGFILSSGLRLVHLILPANLPGIPCTCICRNYIHVVPSCASWWHRMIYHRYTLIWKWSMHDIWTNMPF